MHRRGFLHRGRAHPRGTLGNRPQQMLRRAHHLMEVGDFSNAAALYEPLADGAQDFGLLRQAPHLYLQAARARLYAGQIPESMALLRRGLNLLSDSGRAFAAQQIGRRAAEELEQLGHPAQAQEIYRLLENNRFAENLAGADPAAVSAAPPARLPLHCPSCGAPLRPDEIVRLNARTAECAYCGGAISM